MKSGFTSSANHGYGNLSPIFANARQFAKSGLFVPERLHGRIFPHNIVEFREDDLGHVSGMAESLFLQIFQNINGENISSSASISAPHPFGQWQNHGQDFSIDDHLPLVMSHPAMLQLLYARAIEWRLNKGHVDIGLANPVLGSNIEKLLATQQSTAPLIMRYLSLQGRFLNEGDAFMLSLDDLQAEYLTLIVRAIVSAAISFSARDADIYSRNAREMLRVYDESNGRPYILGKCADRMLKNDEWQVLDIEQSGVSLAYAALGLQTNLPIELLYLLAVEPGLSRLTLALKSADIGSTVAVKFLADTASLGGMTFDDICSRRDFDALDGDMAMKMCRNWLADHGRKITDSPMADKILWPLQDHSDSKDHGLNSDDKNDRGSEYD